MWPDRTGSLIALAVALAVISLGPRPSRAVGQEFIPLDDWSYDAVERFDALGLCVLPADRPYTRAEFIEIVAEISKRSFDARLGPRDRYNLARLKKEFTEFSSRRDPQYRYDPPTFYLSDDPVTFEGDADLLGSVEEDYFAPKTEYYLRSDPSFKIHVTDHLTYDVGYRLVLGPEHGDRARNEKPSRREKSFKGLTSLYEHGYLIAGWRGVHVFAGRAAVDWGPSDFGNLMTPGETIGLDQFGARVRVKQFRLSVFHAQLSPLSRRYFAGHRLELRLGGTVVGLSETVVYSGQSVDPIYVLPLGSFYGNQFNAKANDDNVVWGLDVKTSLGGHVTLYSSFLIDDAQFERDGVNPDKLALDAGGRVALSSPFEATVRARYRFVDIFTYSHHNPGAVYVSGEGSLVEGDVLLGGEPGPDSDSWRVEVEAYPRQNVVARVFGYGQGIGEGNDLRPHVPPADPNPPFPSGVVQRIYGAGGELRWEFNRNQWIGGAYARARVYNLGHTPGRRDWIDAFRIFVHWEFL